MLACAVAGTPCHGMTDDFSVDADGKKGWCGMLDNLRKRRNVIMLLSSNRDKAEICAMLPRTTPGDAIDFSYLRAGRISGHIVRGEDDRAKILPPIDAAFAETVALAAAERKTHTLTGSPMTPMTPGDSSDDE